MDTEPDLATLLHSHPSFMPLLGSVYPLGVHALVAKDFLECGLPPEDCSRFASAVARAAFRTPDVYRSLAHTLSDAITQRGFGHEAYEYLVSAGVLDESDTLIVSYRLKNATDAETILWAHDILLNTVRLDSVYNEFVRRHLDLIARHRLAAMCRHLLEPDRGPSQTNVDTLAVVMKHVTPTEPFQRRLLEWIANGSFDPFIPHDTRPTLSREHAEILYAILNDYWGYPCFDVVVQALRRRIGTLLDDERPTSLTMAVAHLNAMATREYRGSPAVRSEVVARLGRFDGEDRAILERLAVWLGGVDALWNNANEWRSAPDTPRRDGADYLELAMAVRRWEGHRA